MRRNLLIPVLAVLCLTVVALLAIAWRAGVGPFGSALGGWEGRVGRPGDIPACGSYWRAVDAPNPSRDYNELRAVAAFSPKDVWAVGTEGTEEFALTLTEHWDGVEWRAVSSPSIPDYSNHLYGVTALSSDDVWAVGASHRGTDLWRTLALHWDGDVWSVVPSPNDGLISIFNAVTAVSRDDMWAVGEASTGGKGRGARPLIAHWDGVEWSIVPIPNDNQHGALNAVAALSNDDVWVAGSATDKSGALEQPIFLHWDGKEWRKQFTEGAGAIWSLAAVSENDVWAVGNNGPQSLVMRWDGNRWAAVDAPNPSPQSNVLNGVSANGPKDVWAVGSQSIDGVDRPLTAHWDGSQWSVYPSPSTGDYADALSAVAASPDGQAWAAGSSIADANGTSLSLVEHYSEPCP